MNAMTLEETEPNEEPNGGERQVYMELPNHRHAGS